jgi:hypothetical protein
VKAGGVRAGGWVGRGQVGVRVVGSGVQEEGCSNKYRTTTNSSEGQALIALATDAAHCLAAPGDIPTYLGAGGGEGGQLGKVPGARSEVANDT